MACGPEETVCKQPENTCRLGSGSDKTNVIVVIVNIENAKIAHEPAIEARICCLFPPSSETTA